jgi:hypothetical protein
MLLSWFCRQAELRCLQGCTIAVLQDGSVWSFGNNSGGRLGHDSPSQERISSSSLSCSSLSKHSARAMQRSSQSSIPAIIQSSPVPRRIEGLRHVHVTHVSCRYQLSLASFNPIALVCHERLFSLSLSPPATRTPLHAALMAGPCTLLLTPISSSHAKFEFTFWFGSLFSWGKQNNSNCLGRSDVLPGSRSHPARVGFFDPSTPVRSCDCESGWCQSRGAFARNSVSARLGMVHMLHAPTG